MKLDKQLYGCFLLFLLAVSHVHAHQLLRRTVRARAALGEKVRKTPKERLDAAIALLEGIQACKKTNNCDPEAVNQALLAFFESDAEYKEPFTDEQDDLRTIENPSICDELTKDEDITDLSESLAKALKDTSDSQDLPKTEKDLVALETKGFEDKKLTKLECEGMVKGLLDGLSLLETKSTASHRAVAVRSENKNQASQKLTGLEIAGLVALGTFVTYGISRLIWPDSNLPENNVVGGGGAQKVAPIEFKPVPHSALKTLAWHINQNIKKLDVATATAKAASATVAMWPEYGLVTGHYIDPAHQESFGKSVAAFFKAPAAALWSGSVRFGAPEIAEAVSGCGNINAETAVPDNAGLGYVGCIAKKHGLNLVANMLMRGKKWNPFNAHYKKFTLYMMTNVNIVVGADGAVKQIYEKLYPVEAEQAIVKKLKPAPARSTVTLHGIKYGLMVCYDILYNDAGYRNADVHNFLFTTKWTSARDLNAVVVQAAFSRATSSYVHAANVNENDEPLTGTGSGVYKSGVPVEYHFARLTDTDAKVLSSGASDLTTRPARFTGDDADMNKCDDCLEFAIKRTAAKYETAFFCVGDKCKVGDKYVKLENNAEKTKELSVELAGTTTLTCKFTAKATAVGDTAGGELFMAQAALGRVRNRFVRTCTFLAVPGDDPDANGFAKSQAWADFKTVFEHVKVEGNNRGKNIATLPLTAIKDGDKPVVPITPGDNISSSWKVTNKGLGKSELILKANKPIRIVSLYGVQDLALAS